MSLRLLLSVMNKTGSEGINETVLSTFNNVMKYAGAFDYNPFHTWLRNWLIQNKEKVVYDCYEFDRRSMIVFDERSEEVTIKDPWTTPGNESCKPDTDQISQYNEMTTFDKLSWIQNHCNRISVAFLKEDLFDSNSHMWSHLKAVSEIKSSLEYYLESVCKDSNQPSDKVFYFLNYSGTGYYYLKRDLYDSPRNK